MEAAETRCVCPLAASNIGPCSGGKLLLSTRIKKNLVKRGAVIHAQNRIIGAESSPTRSASSPHILIQPPHYGNRAWQSRGNGFVPLGQMALLTLSIIKLYRGYEAFSTSICVGRRSIKCNLRLSIKRLILSTYYKAPGLTSRRSSCDCHSWLQVVKYSRLLLCYYAVGLQYLVESGFLPLIPRQTM